MSLPTGVVTFLMTDVVGSSRLAEQNPDVYLAKLAEHDAIVRRAVEANQGIFLKHRGEGDSTFSVFQEPAAATASALEIHRELSGTLEVRMALHCGATTLIEDDYRGDVINRCARIRSLCHPNQILVSDTIESMTRSRHHFLPLGQHRLRDLSEPIRLFQLATSSHSSFPPLRSVDAFPNNLPSQLSSFVGREDEQAELCLLVGQHRLVTLIGPGGFGKTRLACQVAASLVEDFPGGVWFAPLAQSPGASSPDQILGAIGVALNLSHSNPDAAQGALAAFFGDQSALLILDNCEHLTHSANFAVASLLKSCPGLHLLATSQAVLGHPDETLFRLAALRVQGRRLEALELLIDRAEQRGARAQLAQYAMSELLALCERLGGNALAIELVASRLRALSPRQIVERLDSILASPQFSFEDRHASLFACVQHGFELLDENLKRLVKLLAGFGDFTLEWCEAVLPKSLTVNIADDLQLLYDRSLLNLTVHGDSVRFVMYESIRDFLRRELGPQEAEDWAETVNRTEAFVHEFLSSGVCADLVEQQSASLAKVAEVAISNGRAGTARWILQAARKVWLRRGQIIPMRAAYEHLFESVDTLKPDDAADVCNAYGIALWYQGALDRAAELFTQAQTIWSELGNEERVAAVLNNLALVESDRGDPLRASEIAKQAVQTYQALGNVDLYEQCILNAADFLAQAGDLQSAREQILVLSQSTSSASCAVALANALEYSVLLDDFDAAYEMLRSLAEFRNDANFAELEHRIAMCIAILSISSDQECAAAAYEFAFRSLETNGNYIPRRDQALFERAKRVGLQQVHFGPEEGMKSLRPLLNEAVKNMKQIGK